MEDFIVVAMFVVFSIESVAMMDVNRGTSTRPMRMSCTDNKGNIIPDGHEYVPDEPCKTCTCNQGEPAICYSVTCQAPDCNHPVEVKGECCRFQCRGDPIGVRNGTKIYWPGTYPGDGSGLGLRLLASGATSLLIFVVLLYVIHHLRHRRTLFILRHLYNTRHDEEMTDGLASRADRVDVGINIPPYGDMPPPYTPPKSPGIRDEPPAYDEVLDDGNDGPPGTDNDPQRQDIGDHLNEVGGHTSTDVVADRTG